MFYGSRPVERKLGGYVERDNLTTSKIEESRSGGDWWRAKANDTVIVIHQRYGIIARRKNGVLAVSSF